MDGSVTSDIAISEAKEGAAEQPNNISDDAHFDAASSEVSEFESHQIMLQVDTDESDGQRRSLYLDDDGGAYFDNSQNLETVVRKGESAWNEMSGSPIFQDLTRDNDVLFNPAQKLNFDETEEEDEVEKEFGGIEDEEIDELEIGLNGEEEDNGDSLDGSNYLNHRPRVNGSDLVEDGAVAAIATSHGNLIPDQGQNIRIIEGHDSSLLDDGNPAGASNAFSFNFMQPQAGHPPSSMPSLPSGRSDNNSDEDGQNLYDSLDPEDGTSPYGNVEQVLESNTSEYYSGGSMSLQTMNSQSQSNSDSFWPQEEVSHLRSSTNHVNPFQTESLQIQNFVGNFQPGAFHAAGKSSKESHGPGDDGSCSGISTVPNPHDGFELCEEGLLQGTQLYAQPVTNPSQNFVGSDGIAVPVNTMPSPKSGLYFSVHHSKLESKMQPQSGDYLGKGAAMQSTIPPDRESKMMDLSQSKDGSGGDGVMDERQAAAGSSSSFQNHNQSARPKVRSDTVARKRITATTAQTRRPAVQGSASSELSSTTSNVRLNTAPAAAKMMPGKATQAAGNKSVRANAQGGDSVARNAKPGLANDGSRLGDNGNGTGGKTGAKFTRQYHATSPLSSRASSFASLSSQTGTNSRVSGVGKESHYFQRGPRMNHSLGVDNQLHNTSNHKQDVPFQAIANVHHSQSAPVTNPHVQIQQAAEQNLPNRSSSLIAMSSQSQIVNRYPPQDSMVGVVHGQHRIAHLPMNEALLSQYHAPVLSQQQQQSLQSVSNHQLPSLVSPTGSDHSHHSYNREMVVTQMDAMQRQPGRIPIPENVDPASINCEQAESAVPGMEEVRGHLHSMLNMAVDPQINNELDPGDTATDLLLSDQPVNRQLHFDLDTSSFNGNSGAEDMSEILENFPAFSSKMFTEISGMAHKSESQTQGENQYLRDNLEKERYRRKHCEQQIQKLNAKLLETQQQLAVAVSTDKRKDLMIEQLDKQLAKVVEGWKKRESDKDALLKTMKDEKEHAEECLQRQQTMINNFEFDLAQTVAELKEEKEKSSETIDHLRSELNDATQMKEEAEIRLASAADKCDKMSTEWDTLMEVKVNAEKLAQQSQDALLLEENNWKQKESDLMNKIKQVKEANQKVINMEKVKLEEEKKKREELESEANQLKSELKKLILDVEQLVREKESQKVEMSIMEAKFESAQRKLEADLHTEMEKEIANQAEDYHNKLEKAMEEAGERHRKQVGELHAHHQQDLERQMASTGEELKRKDENHQKKVAELEEKLAENRNEITNLKQSKLKLESQRMEILSKLQFMMQSQWNEAVSLLVSTPQKKGLGSSFLSSQSSVLSGIVPPAEGSNNMSLSSNLNAASLVMSSASQVLATSSLTPEKNNSFSGGVVTENKGTVNSGSNSNSISSRSQKSEHQATWKDRENECDEEKARMDRVEEYVYRMAIQDNNTSSLSRRSNNQSLHSISSQPPTMTAGQGNNNMISAVVHNSSIPSEFQATAIKSPRQMSRFWNDLGMDVHLESGTCAPPPSTSSSSISQNQENHSHISDKANHNQYQHHQRSMPHLNSHHHQHHHHQQQHHQQQHQQRQQQQQQEQQQHERSKEITTQRHLSGSERLFDGVGDQTSYSKDTGPLGSYLMSDNSTLMMSSGSMFDSRNMPTSMASGGDLLTQALSPPVKQSALSRDDLDENVSEAGCLIPDPSRLQANYSHLTEQVDAHMNRQEELQHYIQMLLQKAPGSVGSEPERDVLPNDSDILESSRDLTVDLDMTETAQALEMTHQLTRLQELRERQQHGGHVDGLSGSMLSSLGVNPNNSMSELMLGQRGVLSSQNLAEISQLLSLYREQWEASPESADGANTAGQLIDALKKGVPRLDLNMKTTSQGKGAPKDPRDSPRSQQGAASRKVKVSKDKTNKTKWKSADSSMNGCDTSQPTSLGNVSSVKGAQAGTAPHPPGKKGKAGCKVWK